MPGGRFVLVLFLLLAGWGCAQRRTGNDAADPARRLRDFVERHRKEDGGYGAPGRESSTLPWTFMALECHALLGSRPPRSEALAHWLATFVREGPRPDRRQLEWVLCRNLLGEEKQPGPPLGPLLQELPPLTTWLGSLPLDDLEAAVRLRRLVEPESLARAAPLVARYLSLWRHADGGYHYPAALDQVYPLIARGKRLMELPKPARGPSSLGLTAAAVATLGLLDAPVPGIEETVAFIRSLRAENGGYHTRRPAWGEPDLFGVWHAVRTLRALGAPLAGRERLETVAFVAAHQRSSGAFAHGEGEPDSLEATWLALQALDLLEAPLPDPRWRPAPSPLPAPTVEPGLKLFQAVVEIGPDPAVAVVLAPRIGADLILLKGRDEPELARRARRIASALGIEVEVGCAREEHLRAWGVPGLGYVTHCSDLVFRPEESIGDRGRHASFAEMVNAWRPARAAGAIVFSCSYGHRELLSPAYELSIRGGGGYDALMATWCMSPDGDLIKDWPWLQRYVGRIAVIGNHDAHGDPFHWLYKGLRTRTLFFAKTPDVEGFRDAVRKRRTVAVAHRGSSFALYGHPHWVELARKAREQWDRGRVKEDVESWLPDPIVLPIYDDTAGELAAIREGYGILVRAAGRLGDDALPHEVRCRIDGRPVPLRMVPPERRNRPALFASLPGLASGVHEVEVQAFGRTTRERLRFGKPAGKSSPRRADPHEDVPASLAFDRWQDVAFIRAPLANTTPQGFISLASNRADFILRVDDPRSSVVVLEFATGEREETVEVFAGGTPCGKVHLRPSERKTVRLPVPPGALRRGAEWITLRTDRAPWLPSFPIPQSSLRLHRVAVATVKDGK